jgi:hypothetical protein
VCEVVAGGTANHLVKLLGEVRITNPWGAVGKALYVNLQQP